jgi:hypothetical protein
MKLKNNFGKSVKMSVKSEYLDKEIFKLSPHQLLEALTAVYQLRTIMENGDTKEAAHFLAKNKILLQDLLEYLILNMDNPNLDITLLHFLEKVLGIGKNKSKEKKQDLKEEREEYLSKEELELRYRLLMYEIYKITNPHRIAGETSLENFLNNIQLRGIEVARQYEGARHADKFTKSDLEVLDSHRHENAKRIREDAGVKTGGRGV